MKAIKGKRSNRNPSAVAIVGIVLGAAALAAVAGAGVVMYRLMQK